MSIWMNRWVNRRMNGWIDGWIERWTDSWMGGWLVRLLTRLQDDMHVTNLRMFHCCLSLERKMVYCNANPFRLHFRSGLEILRENSFIYRLAS